VGTPVVFQHSAGYPWFLLIVEARLGNLLMAMDPSGRQTGLKTTQPDSENEPKPAGNQIAIDSVYS